MKNTGVILLLLTTSVLYGQTKTWVKGIVRDSLTHLPLPYVNLIFVGQNTGGISDSAGRYSMATNNPVAQIMVTCLGYRTKTITVLPDKVQTINVALAPMANELQVTVIKPKKLHYRNKDNPAVELMRKVIAHKQENRSWSYDYFESDKYTKIVFGISNVPDKMMHRKSLRKVSYMLKNIDTAKMVGQHILPLYLNELLSKEYSRRSPHAKKEVVYANKKIRFADFIDDVGLMHFVNYMYQDVDVYDENITLFTNKFMSPIAVLSPSFYRFFITDTLIEDGLKCVRLAFFPRNSKDLLFQGYILVALDSTYGVKKIDMTVGKDINLNWVKKLRLAETFEKEKDNRWMISADNIYADFKIGKDAKSGVFGEKSVFFTNPVINHPYPDSYYSGDNFTILEDSMQRSGAYWKKNRPVELEPSESLAYKNMDSLKTVPAYKRDMDILGVLVTGYQGIGPIEFGSIYSLYTYNDVEGSRFRLGTQTSTEFSRKVQFSGFGAYGLTDQIFKYGAGASYSFTNYSIYHFPVKSFTVNYDYDTYYPGENIAYLPADNVLFSVKRGLDNKLFYERNAGFSFLDEFENHFSFNAGFTNSEIAPGGVLQFIQPLMNGQLFEKNTAIESSSVSLLLRYAPNEKTYQKKTVRIPITTYPTYTLQYTEGIKGLTGGQYNYQSLAGSAGGRISLAPLGFSDILLEGGWLFGQVPYPLLFIHRANQTYLFDENSYNLMNFLEFASDKYIALSIDHSFYGFFFNRIPLLRRLNWREGINFKILYGGLSPENNPAINKSAMLLPMYANGVPLTYALNNGPYIEGSFAILNVFKILRFDIVRRFTYLNNPNVSAWGLRAKLKFDF